VRTDLVSIGEAFDDFIFYDLPRLPRPGEELKTGRFSRVPGGGAITTAITAAQLGVGVRVVSAASDSTRERLRACGIDLRDLRRAGEPSALTVALSTHRDRAFVTYNGVNDALERRLLAHVPRVRARYVHCAFYPRRCRRWASIVSALRRRGSTVSWDFGWNPAVLDDGGFETLLAALDIAFVNEAEARLYATVPSLPAAFTWWRTICRATVVKLGRRGAVYISDRAVLRARTRAVRVVDTTGAGDAFNGGYLAAMIQGGAPAACLRAGNRAGASAVMRAGGS
jgi:sugar/nucleoside kinase (ribokinase family)